MKGWWHINARIVHKQTRNCHLTHLPYTVIKDLQLDKILISTSQCVSSLIEISLSCLIR